MKHEVAIRLVSFLLVFGAVAYWEHLSPRRSMTTSKKVRWINNLSLMIGNPILLRLVFPILVTGTALIAQNRGWGLLNNYNLPFWLEFIVGVAILDLVIFFQHVMFHAVPLLWRLHMVHHSVIIRETNSNYGFNLSIWDRLFGTYCDQPQQGHKLMTIGLSQFRNEKRLTFPWLLILPVVGDPGKQPINRH